MFYRLLGPSGIKVSALCLGTMNFGNEERWGCDEKTSREVIESYFEAGGNFIDTANVYSGGRSEEIVGRAIAGRREDVVLATKGYFTAEPGPNRMGSTRLNLRRQVERSLERLGTDHIDLYQVHIWDPLTPIEETLSVLSDLVHEGRIHYLGCCNFTAWQLTMAMERAERSGFERFVTVQPQYNLLCRDIEQEVAGAAELYGLGILPWSPLAFGLLSGKYGRDGESPERARFADLAEGDFLNGWKARYFNDTSFDVVDLLREEARRNSATPVALAVRWLLERPSVTSVIIGPRTVAQLRDNLAAAELIAEPESLERLDEATAPAETYLDFMQGNHFVRRMAGLED
jgi:aryl-alcohol dehydrogenase-like predicted oxidoreductase